MRELSKNKLNNIWASFVGAITEALLEKSHPGKKFVRTDQPMTDDFAKEIVRIFHMDKDLTFFFFHCEKTGRRFLFANHAIFILKTAENVEESEVGHSILMTEIMRCCFEDNKEELCPNNVYIFNGEDVINHFAVPESHSQEIQECLNFLKSGELYVNRAEFKIDDNTPLSESYISGVYFVCDYEERNGASNVNTNIN